MSVLLSIIIPTFNGENTIEEVLNNLASQIKGKKLQKMLEIVVTDDSSTDNTFPIAKKIASRCSFLHVFKNKKNLGMDRNFVQSMLNARGKYVWFCGQDDHLMDGVLEIVIGLLTNNKNVQNVYLDYSQYDVGKKQVVCSSMIDRQLIHESKEDIIYVKNADEYFSVIVDAPSFLPATVVRLDKKLLKKLPPFLNTHYVQYAYFTLGLNEGTTIILRRQLIQGPIPVDGWQKNGNSLYRIAVGKLYCQYLLNSRFDAILPRRLFNEQKKEFVYNYFKLLL
ncbi:glycosyltransferase family 2 protein [Candidatus Woesebacteria bacterium]|nr:glycosyltransferase family 2 protein [Candidatus Woesebacteria bacterium]